MFTDTTVRAFLDQLASNAPTPGGGSVAALTGALGAGLISMVCNLTIGKEKFKDVEADVKEILAQSERLRSRLMELIDADVAAYGKLSAAYKLPRATDEEKKARTAAIQTALLDATAVPVSIAEACSQVIDLCTPAADKGNVGAVSDVGVAVLLAEAGLRSADLNVMINLSAIKDQTFVANTRARVDILRAGKSELKEKLVKEVEAKL
ncbi:MAG: cyclodeaminase/cyclohydrolase family protein [Chloroflexi bacterium]|nr:cyclodeaminase/cyclohydrolase family protein [Chloroflexota bacterium]